MCYMALNAGFKKTTIIHLNDSPRRLLGRISTVEEGKRLSKFWEINEDKKNGEEYQVVGNFQPKLETFRSFSLIPIWTS